MLAWRLSRPLAEIEAMDTRQFMEWVAFFELQSDQMSKHNGKVR